MSQRERTEFVALQARRIAAEMSGRDYEFTPAFIEDVQQAVTHYTKRIGNDDGRALGKRDLRSVFERGRAEAPAITAAFRARNVSPIFGLYLPWIESEYVNLPSQKPMGSIGMFQFLPQTGERFGLSADDLMDVSNPPTRPRNTSRTSLDQFKIGSHERSARDARLQSRRATHSLANCSSWSTSKTNSAASAR